jgi:hypothetical protein
MCEMDLELLSTQAKFSLSFIYCIHIIRLMQIVRMYANTKSYDIF